MRKIDVQDIINNAEVISVEIVNKNGFGMQIYDAVVNFIIIQMNLLFTSGNEIIESRSEETIAHALILSLKIFLHIYSICYVKKF